MLGSANFGPLDFFAKNRYNVIAPPRVHGPISMTFGTLVQNNMLITVMVVVDMETGSRIPI